MIPRLFPKCVEVAERRALPVDLAPIVGGDAARVAILAGDARLLADPITLGATSPLDLISVLRPAVVQGVDATYFSGPAVTGTALQMRVPGCESLAFRELASLSAADRALRRAHAASGSAATCASRCQGRIASRPARQRPRSSWRSGWTTSRAER